MYRLTLLTLLVSIFVSPFSIVAQRKGTVAVNKPAAAPKCSGAWTGNVKYARTQSMTNNKTVQRVSGRGEDTTNFEMKYNYKASVSVLEDPSRTNSSRGRATVDQTFTAHETIKAVESNSCDRGKTWKQMNGTSTSTTETSGKGSVDANVTVGVNADGSYSVSVGIPQIKGQTTGKQTSQYSGQCVPKEGKNLTMPSTETTIDGNSLTSDGSHRVDPSDPNKLSGSFTRTWETVTERITWSLQKCGAPLRLTNLAFEDMKFPNWNEWREITEQKGSIDGNFVKIKATILNASGETKFADVKLKETYKGDKWDGARPDGLLEGGEISVRLEAGEEREVEMVWDSSGYAWFDDGRPRLLQRIKAELEENGKKTDEMTKNLKVAPKPLVLVHGLWSNWRAWEPWQNILTTSHSYDWKAFPVGEKADRGVMNTGSSFLSTDPTKSIGENARELESYINYAQEDRNAWHVDIVAHSMGGLISRYYISQIMPTDSPDGRPKVSRLIMLGTPNMGSPCADVMNVAFEMLGKKVEAVRQLRQDHAEGFNRINVNRKGVKFSVLAGDPLPTMCKDVVWNDGVVPVPSAIWKIADNAKSKSLHTDLTGTKDFSDFVKPRLAIGPKGNHMPEAPSTTGSIALFDSSERTIPNRSYGVKFSNASFLTEPVVPEVWAKSVLVEPSRTVEIELPVEKAGGFGLTFMAQQSVSVELIDPSGNVVQTNKAGTAEASAWFRSLFVDKNVKLGSWKIRMTNTSTVGNASEVILTKWEAAAL